MYDPYDTHDDTNTPDAGEWNGDYLIRHLPLLMTETRTYKCDDVIVRVAAGGAGSSMTVETCDDMYSDDFEPVDKTNVYYWVGISLFHNYYEEPTFEVMDYLNHGHRCLKAKTWVNP